MFNKIARQVETFTLEELHGYGFDDVCAVVEYLEHNQGSAVSDACLHTGCYELHTAYREDVNGFDLDIDRGDDIPF